MASIVLITVGDEANRDEYGVVMVMVMAWGWCVESNIARNDRQRVLTGCDTRRPELASFD